MLYCMCVIRNDMLFDRTKSQSDKYIIYCNNNLGGITIYGRIVLYIYNCLFYFIDFNTPALQPRYTRWIRQFNIQKPENPNRYKCKYYKHCYNNLYFRSNYIDNNSRLITYTFDWPVIWQPKTNNSIHTIFVIYKRKYCYFSTFEIKVRIFAYKLYKNVYYNAAMLNFGTSCWLIIIL